MKERPLSTQSGHAGKGNKLVYCCYMEASIRSLIEIIYFGVQYNNVERTRSFKW